MKTRFDVIQYLINCKNFQNYLEIGTRLVPETGKSSIESIQCKYKTSVDISNTKASHVMSSDDFFRIIDKKIKYDIIFIDGDHEKTQVYKDIMNSLDHLSENGVIVCHDINPFAERQLHPSKCSNAWETWSLLRQTRSDLQMHALTVDMIGVLTKGLQQLYHDPNIEYSWKYLENNRKNLLNVIDIDTFKQIYN